MKKKSKNKSVAALIRVPLKFCFPHATSVRVTGSFNNWDQIGLALNQAPAGEWVIDLNLAAGRHEYRLIVDGEWSDVPATVETVENPFGGRNAVITVGTPP